MIRNIIPLTEENLNHMTIDQRLVCREDKVKVIEASHPCAITKFMDITVLFDGRYYDGMLSLVEKKS
jgi:hypothetical protein